MMRTTGNTAGGWGVFPGENRDTNGSGVWAEAEDGEVGGARQVKVELDMNAVPTNDQRAMGSAVRRHPRSQVIPDPVILCHSCLGFSQPQPLLNSTVTLKIRSGRANYHLRDVKAEVCPTALTHPGRRAEAGSRGWGQPPDPGSPVMERATLWGSITALTRLNLLKRSCAYFHTGK